MFVNFCDSVLNFNFREERRPAMWSPWRQQLKRIHHSLWNEFKLFYKIFHFITPSRVKSFYKLHRTLHLQQASRYGLSGHSISRNTDVAIFTFMHSFLLISTTYWINFRCSRNLKLKKKLWINQMVLYKANKGSKLPLLD